MRKRPWPGAYEKMQRGDFLFFAEKYAPFFAKWTPDKANYEIGQMGEYFFILIFQSLGRIMGRV